MNGGKYSPQLYSSQCPSQLRSSHLKHQGITVPAKSLPKANTLNPKKTRVFKIELNFSCVSVSHFYSLGEFFLEKSSYHN